MQPRQGGQVAILRRFIRCVLEGYGDGTHDDGQHLACSRQRDSQRDAGADALMAGNNQNGGNNGRQRGIRGNRRTDVHPAQGDHFQRTADNNTGFHIAENGADQRTGDQRTVELKFIKHPLHTRNTRDDEHQHNLKKGNLHCTSPVD